MTSIRQPTTKDEEGWGKREYADWLRRYIRTNVGSDVVHGQQVERALQVLAERNGAARDDYEEYFEHTSIPGVHLSRTQAYEVTTLISGERSRLGWIIRGDVGGGEAMWVAWALTSPDGDSFLGMRPTAPEAIQLLWDNGR